MTDWWARDDLWVDGFSVLVPPEEVATTGKQIEGAIRLAHLRIGGRVLDVPCGKGRHAIGLARRGFSVTAVDRCAPLLEAAQASAREQGVTLETVCADMREFVRAGSYDAVFDLYNSFGYFADAADDLRVLRAHHASLAPGGALVLDVIGKELTARGARVHRDWQWVDPDTVLLVERVAVGPWARLRHTWTLAVAHPETGFQKRSFTVDHRLYAATELVDLCRAAGFREAQAFGALDGRPYDDGATHLVVVARV